MGKSTFERLGSDECSLFTMAVGHLVVLVFWLTALAVVELAYQAFGPFPWLVYLLLNAAAGAALLFLAVARCGRIIDGLLDLAEARLKTPDRLQRGFVWFRTKAERAREPLALLITAPIAYGLFLPSDGADGEFFKRMLLIWVSVYGLAIGLLLFASWVAGRFLGTPNTKAT